jgi:hypothetical protein
MRVPTLTIWYWWQMTPGDTVTGQNNSIVVVICSNRTQSHVQHRRNLTILRGILCPPHVSYHELVSTPADSHHKPCLVLDVLVLKIFHVLQMCDSRERPTNNQRLVPCDTMARSPIFMHLPDASHTNAVQTETHLNGNILPEAPLERAPGRMEKNSAQAKSPCE